MSEAPIQIPPEEERDLALGRFMDAWSQLEASLRQLLSVLSQAPPRAAFSIAAAIPDLGRMQELLLALGQMHLSDEDKRELAAICKYLLISNQYRNRIVHGQWLLTNNKDMKEVRGIVHSHRWVRVYLLVDKTKEFEAVLGWDEKAQDQYVFTVERLEERAKKALDFSDRISTFSKRIERKR